MGKPDEGDAASHTIDLLEARLRRVEYVLHGQLIGSGAREAGESAIERLERIQHALDQLVAKSRVADDLLKLHTRHPDFFHASDVPDSLSSLDTASKQSTVLAAASSYPLTASSLTSIMDTQLPIAKLSTNMIETQPQVAELETLQDSQMREIATLRERSVALLQRWYSVDVLHAGECWAEVEERIGRVDQVIRRATLLRKNEDSII